MRTMMIIDTHALIHRFFHALPPLTAPHGEPTNAVYGLANILLKIRREYRPDFLAAAFDRPEKTFREEAFQDYKIQRPPAVPELIAQFTLARELLAVLRVKIVEMAGYEADDLIGTLVERFRSEPDLRIVIVSGDLDLLQLVESDRVVVRFLRKGLSDTTVYDEAAVVARYELPPRRLPDLKGFLGDASDNIPGVKGIGPKTATPLLKKYGTLENVFEHLWELPEKVAAKIEPYQKAALFSRDLVTIKRDAPLAIESIEDVRLQSLDLAAVAEYFRSLGFTSLLPRLES